MSATQRGGWGFPPLPPPSLAVDPNAMPARYPKYSKYKCLQRRERWLGDRNRDQPTRFHYSSIATTLKYLGLSVNPRPCAARDHFCPLELAPVSPLGPFSVRRE